MKQQKLNFDDSSKFVKANDTDVDQLTPFQSIQLDREKQMRADHP